MKKSIFSNNCAVYYDCVKNENKTAVVLIHGYGVNRRMWEPQFDYLSKNYTVINIDVRGHG
ncbi:MAG: alpha/beta fold hydrolase [Bacillota bacterium]